MTIGRETTDGAFDPSKPFRTRDGQRVSDFRDTNAPARYPLEGRVDGRPHSWTKAGRIHLLHESHPLDLINVASTPTPAPSATPGPAEVSKERAQPAVHLSKGCFYRDAKGEKIGPVFRYSGDTWHAAGSSGVWRGDGKLTGRYGGADLVSEWAEAAARVRAPEPARPDAARGEAVAPIRELVMMIAKQTGALSGDTCGEDPDDEAVASTMVDGVMRPDEMTFGHVRRAVVALDRLETAPPIAPTLDAYIKTERFLWRDMPVHQQDIARRLLDRLEAAAPTLPSAQAGDAGGMARAVEIADNLRAKWETDWTSFRDDRRFQAMWSKHSALEAANEIIAALRQADARQDTGGTK